MGHRGLTAALLAFANGRADAAVLHHGGGRCGRTDRGGRSAWVARNAGAALAPLFTGALLAVPTLGLPFLAAGGIKIVY